MIRCPACGVQVSDDKVICGCGADLGLLRKVDAVADAWYNRGVQAAAQGEPGEAVAWFSACCAARPTDAEAHLAKARAWGQLGMWGECRKALAQARLLVPDLDGAADVEQAAAEQEAAMQLGEPKAS